MLERQAWNCLCPECLTWSLISWATTQSRVENGAQRLRWAAGLGCVLAAWGKCAMREDGTSPSCCGFSFQRGCCWARSRRVQPEVSVGRTDAQNVLGCSLLSPGWCGFDLLALHLTTGSFCNIIMGTSVQRITLFLLWNNLTLFFPLNCSVFCSEESSLCRTHY